MAQADDFIRCPTCGSDSRKLEAAEKLLAACKESLKWQAEGEFGDPVPEEFCTPMYRAFMQQLREAIEAYERSL